MKRIIVLILLVCSFHAGAQQNTYSADRIIAKSCFYFKDYWLCGVKKDTANFALDSTRIPTPKAIAQYVAGQIALGGGGSGSSWGLTGNAGTTSSDFIGTTDKRPLRFKVDNLLAGLIDTTTANTTYGLAALQFNTTGEENTAMGSYALRFNTTGNHNTAFGYGAFSNITTGSFNTALGLGAGTNNTTGSWNTILGKSANVETSSTTNAIAIGFGALAGDKEYAISDSIRKLKMTGVSKGVAGYALIDTSGAGHWVAQALPWLRSANNIIRDTTGSAKIGVGTSSPTATLDLPGVSTGNNYAALRIRTGTNTLVSPNIGDIWSEGSNLYYRYDAFTTKEFAFADAIPAAGVAGVTGNGVDNTDPYNPVVNARPYKTLLVRFSQSGSAAPSTDAVVENNTGDTYTWSYIGPGRFRLQFDGLGPLGAHPLANISVKFNIGTTLTTPVIGHYSTDLDIYVEIFVFDLAGAPLNSVLTAATLEINIYP